MFFLPLLGHVTCHINFLCYKYYPRSKCGCCYSCTAKRGGTTEKDMTAEIAPSNLSSNSPTPNRRSCRIKHERVQFRTIHRTTMEELSVDRHLVPSSPSLPFIVSDKFSWWKNCVTSAWIASLVVVGGGVQEMANSCTTRLVRVSIICTISIKIHLQQWVEGEEMSSATRIKLCERNCGVSVHTTERAKFRLYLLRYTPPCTPQHKIDCIVDKTSLINYLVLTGCSESSSNTSTLLGIRGGDLLRSEQNL